MFDPLGFVAKQPSDFPQRVNKARSAISGSLGEVRASPNRLALAGKKHRQRPAALLPEVMQRRHVDLVDVRSFLTVDFDVDKELVHDSGDVFVFEAFVRHDMTPMAGRVPDGEQNGLVVMLRLAECVRAPRPPVHRVVFMLQKIRTALAGKPIFTGIGNRGCHGSLGCTLVGVL